MYTIHDIPNLNFEERNKFLQNILELQKITSQLLINRDKMNKSLQRLQEIVDSLHNEIDQSVNK